MKHPDIDVQAFLNGEARARQGLPLYGGTLDQKGGLEKITDLVFWKIIPWSANLHHKKTIELIEWLRNEGFQVELEYFEDKDNGIMPKLIVWGNKEDLKE